jgi:hypothetical protein
MVDVKSTPCKYAKCGKRVAPFDAEKITITTKGEEGVWHGACRSAYHREQEALAAIGKEADQALAQTM